MEPDQLSRASSSSSQDSKQRAARGTSALSRYFKVYERDSSLWTEFRAGCTTFLTLAYILAVNPLILADSGGTCTCEGPDCINSEEYEECMREVRRDLVIATAVASGLATLLMGIFANLPFALAPGMGMNAYFTYGVVGYRGTGKVSYEIALGAVFIEGVLFMLTSACGWRYTIAMLIPKCVRISTTAGIGVFLATLGMTAGAGIGLVVSDAATGNSYGGCSNEHRVPFYVCPNTKGIPGVPDGLPTVGPRALELQTFENLANFTPWYDCVAGTRNVFTCDMVVTNWQSVTGEKDPVVHGGRHFENPTLWLGFAGFFLCGFLLKKKRPASIITAVILCSFVSWIPNTAFSYWDDGGDLLYFSKVKGSTRPYPPFCRLIRLFRARNR
jgi:AGZA family xanthine/uracil permease-like MFS transporter